MTSSAREKQLSICIGLPSSIYWRKLQSSPPQLLSGFKGAVRNCAASGYASTKTARKVSHSAHRRVSSNDALLFNQPFSPIAAKMRRRVNGTLGLEIRRRCERERLEGVPRFERHAARALLPAHPCIRRADHPRWKEQCTRALSGALLADREK